MVKIGFGDTERQRALATDNIDVKFGEGLIGGKVSERRSRRRIRDLISITNFP